MGYEDMRGELSGKELCTTSKCNRANRMYLLAINCGSSSIKGKLYALPKSKSDELNAVASLSVSNISSKGEKIKIKICWDKSQGKKDLNEEGEDGASVECKPTASPSDQSLWCLSTADNRWCRYC